MRIVSQCGQADFPYERTYILSDRANVKAVCDGKSYVIGRYSTHEKAIKAMEMCRQEYGKYFGVHGGVSPITGAVTQPGIFTYPKVFQFPKEEEV